MVRLRYAATETNSVNTNGLCTALYFESAVSRAEISEALWYVRSHRAEFPDVPLPIQHVRDFNFLERATALSTQAGWCRYECYGFC